MKRKVRIYDDIELLEVSPVGIPSYPAAINKSLIKSLLNKMAEEENTQQANESSEEKKQEEPKESSEEKTEEQEKTEEKTEEKPEESEKATMVAMSKDSIQELILGIAKEFEAKREGLVAKQNDDEEEVDEKEMTAGDAAIKCGLFNKNDLRKTF